VPPLEKAGDAVHRGAPYANQRLPKTIYLVIFAHSLANLLRSNMARRTRHCRGKGWQARFGAMIRLGGLIARTDEEGGCMPVLIGATPEARTSKKRARHSCSLPRQISRNAAD
jgi:hypothetical protein